MVGMRRKTARPVSPSCRTSSLTETPLDYQHGHPHDNLSPKDEECGVTLITTARPSYKKSSRMSKPFRLLSSWSKCLLLALFVLLILTYTLFHSLRHLLMSRPRWIYGSPVSPEELQHIQECLQQQQRQYVGDTRSTEPYYEWYYFSNATSNSLLPGKGRAAAKKRLLIAQYSGYGSYSQMLDVVAPVNARYAQLWHHDFVLLQGTAMDFPGISCTHSGNNKNQNDNKRSTFNKIPLLELAYNISSAHHDRTYDQVLILDTDAMFVNFEKDITTLLPDNKVLAAHQVWDIDHSNTWDVNAGITLWNLHHPDLPTILKDWKQAVQENPYLVLERNDDQYFLQVVLQRMGGSWWHPLRHRRPTLGLTREFRDHDATLIGHFKRLERKWQSSSLELQGRLQGIEDRIDSLDCPSQVCQYPLKTQFASRRQSSGQRG